MARPRIEISTEQFESLCNMQCTLGEIAGFFKCSEDTIERWCKRTYKDDDGKELGFAEVHKRLSVKGRISLRRWQFRSAENGNTSMLIWLGKQYLEQKDIQDVTITNTEAQNQLAEVLDMWKQSSDDEMGQEI